MYNTYVTEVRSLFRSLFPANLHLPNKGPADDRGKEVDHDAHAGEFDPDCSQDDAWAFLQPFACGGEGGEGL